MLSYVHAKKKKKTENCNINKVGAIIALIPSLLSSFSPPLPLSPSPAFPLPRSSSLLLFLLFQPLPFLALKYSSLISLYLHFLSVPPSSLLLSSLFYLPISKAPFSPKHSLDSPSLPPLLSFLSSLIHPFTPSSSSISSSSSLSPFFHLLLLLLLLFLPTAD